MSTRSIRAIDVGFDVRALPRSVIIDDDTDHMLYDGPNGEPMEVRGKGRIVNALAEAGYIIALTAPKAGVRSASARAGKR